MSSTGASYADTRRIPPASTGKIRIRLLYAAAIGLRHLLLFLQPSVFFAAQLLNLPLKGSKSNNIHTGRRCSLVNTFGVQRDYYLKNIFSFQLDTSVLILKNMNHLFPFKSKVSYDQRKIMMQQEPRLVWLTGLSGSGKSTLALRLEHYLFHKGFKVFLLDGDNVRNGLNSDLSFTAEDRKENLRRVGEVAKLMLDAGLVVLCAFISPSESERALVKVIVGASRFTEVYINCALEVCENRDTKGLYAKARRGLISNFTGISAPYEIPLHPDLELQTDKESIEESMYKLISFVEPQLQDRQPAKAFSER